jgi:acetyltransferase-like isoleucine patch superfamily enzyme
MRLINKLRYWYHDFKKSIFTIRGKNNRIIKSKKTVLFIKYDIDGNNNNIEFGDCYLRNVTIKIRGNNNHIKIADEVYIYGGILWIEDHDNTIEIDKNTSIQTAHLAVTEGHRNISIGKNCMLAEEVIIRTGDSHPIFDLETQVIINEGKSVVIKDHVWIGTRSQILKGVTINKNSIVGAGSIVTQSVLENTIVAGNPARIVKEGINWKAERDGLS